MRFLRRMLFRKDRPEAGGQPLPRLDPPVWVVGDVHGCDAPLAAMLALAAGERVVIAGDMIDRGPASGAVLARLMAEDAGRVTCLMGNHERMLLDALDAPRAVPRWLAAGGDATLASLGLPARWPAGEGPGALVAALRPALPPGAEAWLRARPLWWAEGGLAVAHAGADPARPMAAQTEAALLWGHRDFLHRPRRDGLWLVHGHVVVAEAHAAAGRIAVDTGAWATGRLSAARIGPDGVTLHTT